MNNLHVESLFLSEHDRKVINGTLGKKWSIVYKFGENETTEGTYELTAPFTWTQMTSADTMNVVSDSANDTSAGTGARTIKIIGLDGNYDEIEEIVTMNGLSSVTTTKSFIIIHRAIPNTAGSTETNVGNITITDTTGGTTQALIHDTQHSTIQGFSMVPRGYHAVLVRWEINAGKGDDFKSHIMVKPFGGAFYELKSVYIFENNISYDFNGAIVVPEKSTFKIEGRKTTAGSRPINGGYTYLLIEN